ncbi:MAG: hypothetical protein LBF97_02095 [Elusimicrobiota bacterium]|jgi:hypothetical protein|nr:hypothetical protein [Elusimicrobiota bacterium]
MDTNKKQILQDEVDKNYQFFKTKLDEIIQKYFGKYALLRHSEIIDYFDSLDDAIKYANAIYTDKLYSIQKVENDGPVNLGFIGVQLNA